MTRFARSLVVSLALAGACLLSACAAQQQPVAPSSNTPVQGALPPPPPDQRSDRVTEMGAPLRNSDNRPLETRSGLNSDPNNPSGAPGYKSP